MTPIGKPRRGLILLAFLLGSTAAPAEIYKWVDANGRTHFSERPDDAGRAKAVDPVETTGGANRTAARAGDAKAQAEYWQERDRQFRERQLEQQNGQKAKTPVADARPKSLSGGRAGDTDASRCALARDVLSGAVRHGNGKPTDQYDRDVAASDVRTFCH